MIRITNSASRGLKSQAGFSKSCLNRLHAWTNSGQAIFRPFRMESTYSMTVAQLGKRSAFLRAILQRLRQSGFLGFPLRHRLGPWG